ncbi:hypothetical protein ACWGNE_08335 [Streptomyces xiamenensis]
MTLETRLGPSQHGRAVHLSPPANGVRFGVPQAATVLGFPLVGGVLYLTGAPTTDILLLLSGCGAIGTGVLLATHSSRRRLASAAAALLQVTAGRQ